MANDAAIQFLTKKLTGLQVIQQDLGRIYTTITDLDFADEVRDKLTTLNETIFALHSALNGLLDASTVVAPPSEAQVAELETALQQLDAYVQSDQNIHMAINYLLQASAMIKAA